MTTQAKEMRKPTRPVPSCDYCRTPTVYVGTYTDFLLPLDYYRCEKCGRHRCEISAGRNNG